jgi:hypothetical protein
MKTKTNLSSSSINTLFMRFMKKAGALVSQKGITVNSYYPYRSLGALDHQRRDLHSIKLSHLTEDRVASTIRLCVDGVVTRHGRR